MMERASDRVLTALTLDQEGKLGVQVRIVQERLVSRLMGVFHPA